MSKLSIIIACLNDHNEIIQTVLSIQRTTHGRDLEVIVIDDCSDDPIVLPSELNVSLFRNAERLGPGASRHIGVEKATGDYILLLDSHMRFEAGWYEKAMERITLPGREKFAHCGSCVGLESADMFMEEFPRDVEFGSIPIGRRIIVNKTSHARKVADDTYSVLENERPTHFSISPSEIITLPASPRYYGAQLNILGLNPNDAKEFQVFEGVWQSDKPGDDYEISCLMGACYFFKRDFFLSIGGLKWNRQWGSEEPNLSLKTYLAGGSVRIMKGVRVGHKFHTGNLPYKLFEYWKVYNKIRSIQTIFNECEAAKCLEHFVGARDLRLAMIELEKDRQSIVADRVALQGMLVHDLEWFCKKFGIHHPLQ